MKSCGPLLVYDKNFRKFSFVDEERSRRAFLELIVTLRSAGSLDPDVMTVLRQLLRTDPRLPSVVDSILLPRVFELIQPRYHLTNFLEFKFLGSGGFGAVFEAQHRLDSKLYAIKVVDGIRCLEDLERASSEVAIMARLRHRNVVQYVTSWVEYGSGPLGDIEDGETYPSSSSQNFSLKDEDNYLAANSNELFSAVSPSLESENNPSWSSVHSGTFPKKRELWIAPFQPKASAKFGFGPRLFIQLELCNYNLAQWLEHRNTEFSRRTQSSGPIVGPKWWQTVPHAPGRWLADQLVCGLAYLHSNGMMHRDLKPENVLLSGPPLPSLSDRPCVCQPSCYQLTHDTCDSHSQSGLACYHRLMVKICDFGLSRFLDRPHSAIFRPFRATDRPLLSYHRDLMSKTRPTRTVSLCSRPMAHILADPPRRRAHSYSFVNRRVSCNFYDEVSDGRPLSITIDSKLLENRDLLPSPQLLTGHIGSELYAAPEVRPATSCRCRVVYDYKADIYSLGVIFLQLFYPFCTSHELVACLQGTNDFQQLSTPQRGEQRGRPTASCPTHHVHLPSSFLFSWPEESRVVERMLQQTPSQRPSAFELENLLASNSEYPGLIAFRANNHTICPPLTSLTVEDQGDSSLAAQLKQPTIVPEQPLIGGSHRLLDMALWRTQELERELAELRQPLTRPKSDSPAHED